MRRWTSGAMAATVAMLALQPAARAMPDPAHLIVPGKAIGPVALGSSLGEVQARIGPPDEVRPLDSGHALLQWRAYGLVVGIQADRVVLVGTNSRQYQTSTGLKVGVKGTRALTLFPGLTPPAAKGLSGLSDDVMGINFLHHPADGPGEPNHARLDPDWRIDEINVYQPATDQVLDRQADPSP